MRRKRSLAGADHTLLQVSPVGTPAVIPARTNSATPGKYDVGIRGLTIRTECRCRSSPIPAPALTYGALFALGNAVLISTVAIAIRRMSMTESAETLTLYQMSIMTLCTAGLLTRGTYQWYAWASTG